jgi:hypothetical protein
MLLMGASIRTAKEKKNQQTSNAEIAEKFLCAFLRPYAKKSFEVKLL